MILHNLAFQQKSSAMEVNDKEVFSKVHSIEWGGATWGTQHKSIRNRYDNAKGGKFNYAGSSEVSWEDFNTMIKKSIERNHFSKNEMQVLLSTISEKLT